MKFLFWVIGLFALAVALTLAAQNPGYMLMVYPPYRIEMSLSLFVVGMVALFVVSHMALQLISAALRLPAYVRHFRTERIQAQAHASTMEALNAFFEGRYAAAEKAAVRAMEQGADSALNPVVAARAAHELHEFDKRDAYLAATAGKSLGDSTLRLMATIKFSLDQRQPQAALEALQALRKAGVRGHVGALHMELKAQQQAHNWDAVLDVVSQLEKRGSIEVTVATQLRQQAWLEKIRARPQQAAALLALWKSIPPSFRRGRIAAAAASVLIELGECRHAQQIITEILEAQWDSSLVTLYADCIADDVVGQIEQAERWLGVHSHDAGLLLVLGRLCLHQGLWGKAQSYLEASVSVHPSHEAYTALAQLAEKLQKPDESFKYFQKAVECVKKEHLAVPAIARFSR
ncbi:MAG: heme biosynthesis HemY N-terminal domain-containing protein [Pseudomonadota bacterium]